MTIVYIINQLRKSGPVEVLYNLVKNLHRFSVTPVIIRMMEDDTDRSITPAFKELGIEVLEFSYSFIDLELRTRWVAQSLEQLFVGRKVDLIHTHGYHPVLVARDNALYLSRRFCEFKGENLRYLYELALPQAFETIRCRCCYFRNWKNVL